MKRVYLDNNATTKTDEEVVKEMLPYFTEFYANASSMHSQGQQSFAATEGARKKIANLLGLSPLEIVFTASGTEADNMALRGVAKRFIDKETGKPRADKNHIITTEIEHPAVKDTCKALEKEGFEVTYLGVDKDGIISLEELENAITDKTFMVSIMYANNEIGSIQPIKEIGEITSKNKLVFHVDAVQAVGKLPINIKESNIDLLAFSGHKFYGPKGVGALYIKMGTRMNKILTGGHQERKRRPGTTDTAAIVGMAKALEMAYENMEEEIKRETELRNYFEEEVQKRVPEVIINGNKDKKLPGTTSLTIKYVEGESLLLNLDLKGIAVSSGSACSSDDLKASPSLLAIGLPDELAHGTLRFSLGRYNTKEEIDYVLEVLPPIVEKLRYLSPLWDEFKNN